MIRPCDICGARFERVGKRDRLCKKCWDMRRREFKQREREDAGKT